MRVDYTLPSLQPDMAPDLPVGVETGTPSFSEQLRSQSVQLPVSWEQQLNLDARPFTGTYIGPPPRPQTMEIGDPETERSRWRNMLQRHGGTQEPAKGATNSGTRQPVQAMLELLQEMQEMEDSITSQNVAVTRG